MGAVKTTEETILDGDLTCILADFKAGQYNYHDTIERIKQLTKGAGNEGSQE